MEPMTLYMLSQSGVSLEEDVERRLEEELGTVLTRALLSEDNRSNERFEEVSKLGAPVYPKESTEKVLKQVRMRAEAA